MRPTASDYERRVAADRQAERRADGAEAAWAAGCPDPAMLDLLASAIADRDRALVRAIVTGPDSTRLPREVRVEALALVELPTDSLRAPIALWRLAHTVRQLLFGDDLVDADTVPLADPDDQLPSYDPLQLELAIAGRVER
jgi:hypothetical protein